MAQEDRLEKKANNFLVIYLVARIRINYRNVSFLTQRFSMHLMIFGRKVISYKLNFDLGREETITEHAMH